MRFASALAAFLSTAVALPCGAASQQTFRVHPATQDPSVRVDLAKIARWEEELSNWGRWGPSDQRGTLNLITPEKTRQAASTMVRRRSSR